MKVLLTYEFHFQLSGNNGLGVSVFGDDEMTGKQVIMFGRLVDGEVGALMYKVVFHYVLAHL